MPRGGGSVIHTPSPLRPLSVRPVISSVIPSRIKGLTPPSVPAIPLTSHHNCLTFHQSNQFNRSYHNKMVKVSDHPPPRRHHASPLPPRLDSALTSGSSFHRSGLTSIAIYNASLHTLRQIPFLSNLSDSALIISTPPSIHAGCRCPQGRLLRYRSHHLHPGV